MTKRSNLSLRGHLVLLNGVDHLLDCVSHELQVLKPLQLTLFDPCVDREESRLVDLLRLDQGFNPAILPLFERLNHFFLVKQMLFVLGEVLCAYVLNLTQLLIILLLEGLSVGLGCRSDIVHERLQCLNLLLQLRLERLIRLVDLRLHIGPIRSDNVFYCSHLIQVEFVHVIDLGLNVVINIYDFILEIVSSPL